MEETIECPEFPCNLPPNSVLVFGGSFNPVHVGHLAILKALLILPGNPLILVIPAGLSPFKSEENQLPSVLRWQLLQAGLPTHPRVQLLDWELTQVGPSYSYQTWQKLAEVYPDKTWIWVLGTDTFAEFDRWHQAHELLQGIRLLVIQRRGYGCEMFSGWGPLLRLLPSGSCSPHAHQLEYNGDWLACRWQLSLPEANSTAIRQGMAPPEWLIPSTVSILQNVFTQRKWCP